METKRAVSFDSPNMKVKFDPSNNSFSIMVENRAKNESADFKRWLDSLPDELLNSVCEFMGNEKIKKISTLLESNDIEQVRSGIIAIKNAIREYCISQIENYKKLLKNL